MNAIRPPAVAGMFYEAEPSALAQTVDTLLEQAATNVVHGVLRGLIVPHAGYMYSGLTAAMAYRLLKGKRFDGVVIVAPSHREYFEGATVYPGDAYRTPLGDVLIHRELREALAENSNIVVPGEEGHRSEHSVEVQLPFLQQVLGSFSFVPLVMGNQSRSACDVLADNLRQALAGRDVLLIASSDLSHYHSYEMARSRDRTIIHDIGSFDDESLMSHLENDVAEACGGGPMVVVMKTLKALGANHSSLLFSCNSGDVTGQKDAVVGYCSAAFTRLN